MAAGAGMYEITFFATVLIVFIQTFFSRIAARLESHGTIDITLALKDGDNVNEKVKKIYEYTRSKPSNIKMTKNVNGTLLVKMTIHVRYNISELELLDKIKAEEEIIDISLSS